MLASSPEDHLKKLFRPILTILLLFSLQGCFSKNYQLEDCETLSMKKFKGWPNAANEFDDHCLKYDLKYSQKTCQQALQALIAQKSEEDLKKTFGDQIMDCFTSNDLDNFLKARAKDKTH